MSNNIRINSATGTEDVRTEEIGGVHTPATFLSNGAALATDRVMNGDVALTPKFAAVAVAGLGDNTVVTEATGKKIRVLAYALAAAGPVSVKWRSAANDRTGALPMAANGSLAGAFCPVGHFETAAGEALVLNLSGAVAVGGHIVYVEV